MRAFTLRSKALRLLRLRQCCVGVLLSRARPTPALPLPLASALSRPS